MIRKLYNWTLLLGARKSASAWLFGISFVESSIFPIPPDVLLLPMALGRRERAFHFAAIATFASVLGALLGYGIGYFFWEALGSPIMEFYGFQDEFQSFQNAFVENGAWLVLFFGVTFFPFKVITIASGVVALDPVIFVLSAIVARALRFFIVCSLLWKFGEPIKAFIEKRLGILVALGTLLLIAGFWLSGFIGG